MSNLFGDSNELKVFKCPYCSEYISSNNKFCPKCSYQISDEVKQSAIDTENKEVREENRKFYKSVMYSGIGFFLMGGLVILYTVFSVVTKGEGPFYVWSPFITLIGFGQIIYGLNGMRKER